MALRIAQCGVIHSIPYTFAQKCNFTLHIVLARNCPFCDVSGSITAGNFGKSFLIGSNVNFMVIHLGFQLKGKSRPYTMVLPGQMIEAF